MNINCPKCGFTQPQDQYCARCGVDITTYKAPPKPILKQIAGSLLFQLMLVFFFGGSAVYWVHQNSVQKTNARIQFLKGTSLQVQSSAERNQFESTREAPTPPTISISEPATDFFEPEKSPQINEKSKAEVSLQFLEVPEGTLNLWLQQEVLTRIETTDQLLMGYIQQDLTQLLSNTKYQIKTLKSENFAFATDQIFSTQLKFPKASDEGQIRHLASQQGVSAYATIDSMTEDTVIGQLEVSLDQQNSFPIRFEMSPTSSVVLTGFSKLKGIEKSPESELMVVFSLKK